MTTHKNLHPLKLVAGREVSQQNVLRDVTNELATGDVRHIVVLLEFDNGDSAFFTSMMDRAQMVWMCEMAKHDALCLPLEEDEVVPDPEDPEAA